MQISLQDKVAIVTGSIQGIGLQIARTLAENGARVIINNHQDPERLEAIAQNMIKAGLNVKAVVADVTVKSGGLELIRQALEFNGRIDILVNNAGGLVKRVPVCEFDEAHFQTVIEVNLKSAFLMAALVAPYLKNQKSGRIINLSSQAAHDGGGPGAAVYSASKGGIWTFTKALAKELAPYGITVNCISPGFIAGTAFHTTFTSPEVHKKMEGMIPLGRLGEAQDIANVALFLASDLARYMTGQSLEVNGGLYMP